MAQSSTAGRSLVEFIVMLLIGLAPVACGLLVLVLQAERKYKETIEVTAQEAVYAIDAVIKSLHITSRQALELAGRPCDNALSQLRHLAIRQPNVRSLVLLKDDRAYCSTLYGEFDLAVDPTAYFNQRLRLDPGNEVTPDSAVLHYRLSASASSVNAIADIRVLQAELLGFQNDVVLILQFGAQTVWATGNGVHAQAPNHADGTLGMVSQEYGYTVYAGYPEGHFWEMIRQALFSTLPSLILVGILTSAAGYWGLFRRTLKRASPPQQ